MPLVITSGSTHTHTHSFPPEVCLHVFALFKHSLYSFQLFFHTRSLPLNGDIFFHRPLKQELHLCSEYVNQDFRHIHTKIGILPFILTRSTGCIFFFDFIRRTSSLRLIEALFGSDCVVCFFPHLFYGRKIDPNHVFIVQIHKSTNPNPK